MKVAIVHDWLVGGGAEKVVEQLHIMYPEAPIYTSVATKEWQEALDGMVVTGYLNRSPFRQLRKYLAPLRGLWFSRLDLRGYDLVISSKGNGEASYIKRLRPGAKHICYCHSPTHFYWRKYDGYLRNPGFGMLDPIARIGLRILAGPMRRWDYASMQRTDSIIANSSSIQAEIKKSYGRESAVVNPPVNTERFRPSKRPRNNYVTAGRQVPYKHQDLAVIACSELELPLTVLGNGPENRRLKELAGPTITFIDSPTDDEMAHAFAQAKAFIQPAEEDFGITPVEAMAAGCPVIAYGAGGALDYVDQDTGYLFNEQTVKSLSEALIEFNPSSLSSPHIVKSAHRLHPSSFRRSIQRVIDTVM